MSKATEYKLSCINCQKEIAQIRIKGEIVCDCKSCGLYVILKPNNTEGSFDDDFLLDLHVSKNIVWTNTNSIGEVLSCPFCVGTMKRFKNPNFQDDMCWKCERCRRNFFTECLY